MSDGPHRSLKMSPKWKQVAERIHNEAYILEEVGNALSVAVEEDWRREIPERLVSEVQKILSSDQSDFFCNHIACNIESLWEKKGDSPLSGAFVDHVLQAVTRGTLREDTLLEAVRGVALERAARGLRQIEEHCLRESQLKSVARFRQRIQGAIGGLDTAAIVSQLVGVGKRERPQASLKQTGLEDGVAL